MAKVEAPQESSTTAKPRWLAAARRPLPFGAGMLAICIAAAVAILLYAIAALYDVNDGRLRTAIEQEWTPPAEPALPPLETAPSVPAKAPPLTDQTAVIAKNESAQAAGSEAIPEPESSVGPAAEAPNAPPTEAPKTDNVRGVVEFPEMVNDAVFISQAGLVATKEANHAALKIYNSADLAKNESPRAEIIQFEAPVTALGSEVLDNQPLLLAGLSSPPRLVVVDARTRRTIREIASDEPLAHIIASADPKDHIAYFIAGDRYAGKLHEVDLREGKVVNSFNCEFSTAHSSRSGEFLYAHNHERGPWVGFRPLPSFYRRIQGDFEQFPLNQEALGKLLVSPAHDVVAVGRELYNTDLSTRVARLSFLPNVFFENEPFLAGIDGNKLYVASTNSYQEVATLPLPAQLVLDPRDVADHDENATWRKIFHDPQNSQLIVVTRRRIMGVDLALLKLPSEPLLAPRKELPRTLYAGKKESVELKFTGADPALQMAKGPEGAVLNGRTISWTPTQQQYGRQEFHFIAAADGTPHQIDWSPRVEWERVEFGYRPEKFFISIDGTRAIAWGPRRHPMPGEQTPSLYDLTLIDLPKRQILAQRQLNRGITDAVIAGSDVIVLSGGQLLRFAGDGLEPKDSATVYHGGPRLSLVADKFLAVFGGEYPPRRYRLPDLKSLDPATDYGSHSRDELMLIGRTAFGWCWDGMLWDDSLTTPRLLIQPREFTHGPFLREGVLAPNAPQRITVSVPGWHPFCPGLRPVGPYDPPMSPDIPSNLEVVAREGTMRLTGRTLSNGTEQFSMPICPERQYMQVGGVSPDQGTVLTGKDVVGVLLGAELRLGEFDGTLKGVEPPFHLNPVQSTFILNTEASTTVKYEAHGAKSFHLDSRDLSPTPNQGDWFHAESSTGEFTIDLSECIDAIVERAVNMASSVKKQEDVRTNRQLIADYVKRVDDQFRQITGVKPKGVPTALQVMITAEGSDFQMASIYHYFLIDVPLRLVEEKLDARLPAGRELWQDKQADQTRQSPAAAHPEPDAVDRILVRLLGNTAADPVNKESSADAAEIAAAKKLGDDRLLAAFAADDSADDLRMWTDASGRNIEASLVQEFGGQVVLRTPAGRELTLDADKLSAEDRAYLATAATPSTAGDGVRWRRFLAKRIAAALTQFHTERRCFPPQSLQLDGGDELVSWRVWLLPQLGYPELFSLVRPREAWDSETNRELASQMPLCFAFDPDLTEQHKTPIVAISSPLSALRRNKVVELAEAVDGPESAVVFAEGTAGNAVAWMEPKDLSLESLREPAEALRFRDGRVHAGLMDGTALELPQDMPRTQWREAVDISDRRRSEIVTELRQSSKR